MRASLTSSWKRRSSSTISGSLLMTELLSPHLLLGGDDVEGVDEVAAVVRRADDVGELDRELAVSGLVGVDADVLDLDARLPAVDCDPHLALEPPDRVSVDALEHVVVDAATEQRPHRALAGSGREDQADRLVDVVGAADEGHRALTVDAEREAEAGADDLRHD